MLYQLKIRRKEIIVIIFIITFALVATNRIYYKFINSSNYDINTATLDVTYHSKGFNEINMNKMIPVTDSVGLSSKSYTFTIKNNTNSSLKYAINIADNKEMIKTDECKSSQIPHNLIRFSIHKKNERNNIYTLSDLVNGNILTRIIQANSEEEYTMRFWVSGDELRTTSNLHYHGLINVEELGQQVAIAG